MKICISCLKITAGQNVACFTYKHFDVLWVQSKRSSKTTRDNCHLYFNERIRAAFWSFAPGAVLGCYGTACNHVRWTTINVGPQVLFRRPFEGSRRSVDYDRGKWRFRVPFAATNSYWPLNSFEPGPSSNPVCARASRPGIRVSQSTNINRAPGNRIVNHSNAIVIAVDGWKVIETGAAVAGQYCGPASVFP